MAHFAKAPIVGLSCGMQLLHVLHGGRLHQRPLGQEVGALQMMKRTCGSRLLDGVEVRRLEFELGSGLGLVFVLMMALR